MTAPRVRVFLSSFQSVLPRYRLPQTEGLDWLAEAHTLQSRVDRGYRRMAERFGCGADRISQRWHEPVDFQEKPRTDSLVFAPLSQKMEFYGAATARVFQEFYPDSGSESSRKEVGPDELIHVTCTGYLSPSPAQRRVVQKGWARQTRVTHAYHMGCYAALPALRMAEGALLRFQAHSPLNTSRARVDVAHTEICSLHFAPGDPRPDQWVIQSLFADGFIRYQTQLFRDPENRTDGFELVTLEEEMVPGTEDQMTWMPAEKGFAMTLGREVPQSLTQALPIFIERLLGKAGEREGCSLAREQAVFAVHPGGPKIIDGVEDVLRLSRSQTVHSREVLRERGNLSSATLPHIWMSILEDSEVKNDTPIVSLAFGPGLSLFGSVMRKRVAP